MNTISAKDETGEINWETVDNSIKEFTFKGEEKLAKCVSVYDGDTVRVVFPIYKTLYKWNCRLNRIDTPELRTNNVLEQSFGYEVRDKIRERILGKMVKIKCDEFDKYGRLLAEIYYEGESINQWLIDNKYAFEYDGGTKKFWEPYLKEKGYVAIPKENKKPEKVKKAKKENKKNENEKENETEMETEKEKENLKTFEEDGNKDNDNNQNNGEELLRKKKGRSKGKNVEKKQKEKVQENNEEEVEEKKANANASAKAKAKPKPKPKKKIHKGKKRDSESSSCDEDFIYNSSEASYEY